MLSRLLWNTKNAMVRRFAFLRSGPIARVLRRWYKAMLRWANQRTVRRADVLRRALLGNVDIRSATLDRGSGIIVEFAEGRRYRWKRFDDPEDLLGRIVMSGKQDFEPEATELFSRIVHAGDTVFDIGANFGWHSVHFGQLVGPRGAVYCFEPLPDMFDDLKENIGLNFSDGAHIVCERHALSNREGGAMITVPEKGTGFATIQPAIGKGIEIDTTTLDAYVRTERIAKIDLIKCDVEGAEPLVVEGGRSVLRERHAPLLFFEVNPEASRKIFDDIKGFGYRAWYFKNGKLHALEDHERADLPDYNFLFTKDHHRGRIKDLLI